MDLAPDTCGPTPAPASRRCRLSSLGAPFSFRLRIAPPPALLPGASASAMRSFVVELAKSLSNSPSALERVDNAASRAPFRLTRTFRNRHRTPRKTYRRTPCVDGSKPPIGPTDTAHAYPRARASFARDSQDVRHKTKPAHTRPRPAAYVTMYINLRAGQDMRIATALSSSAQRLCTCPTHPRPRCLSIPARSPYGTSAQCAQAASKIPRLDAESRALLAPPPSSSIALRALSLVLRLGDARGVDQRAGVGAGAAYPRELRNARRERDGEYMLKSICGVY
ncbi:hypothetical protein MSAN_00225600 [Mycena sanguinolenta]|uniref:Uncharacterized protein n=1 Tax=Mycena sanguinolenta TaxID=230812 RepID=A0A8H6ZHR2_9AGAR|nr:hypothetical protein MSAN_00225600 [Mycena sanguinolenta]